MERLTYKLNERQRTTMQRIAQGHSHEAIGNDRGVTPNAVSTDVMRVQQKLHCTTTPEVVALLAASGAVALVLRELELSRSGRREDDPVRLGLSSAIGSVSALLLAVETRVRVVEL